MWLFRKAVFDIVPYKRVGPIIFGMPRSEISKALKANPVRIKSGPVISGIEPRKIDSLTRIGINIDYSPEDKVEGITYFKNRHITLRYKDLLLTFDKSLPELRQELSKYDAPEDDDQGTVFKKLGIGLVKDTWNVKTHPPEGIEVFGQGYLREVK